MWFPWKLHHQRRSEGSNNGRTSLTVGRSTLQLVKNNNYNGIRILKCLGEKCIFISSSRFESSNHRTQISHVNVAQSKHVFIMSLSRLYHVFITSLSCLYHVFIMSLSRLYHVFIMSLSCLYHVKTRLYHVFITSLSRLYHVFITSLSRLYHVFLHIKSSYN